MKTALYGAIIGDMVGSPYEGRFAIKTKHFELLNGDCNFTDDSVLTIAVADALLQVDTDADEDTVRLHVKNSLQVWGRKYIYAGYSGSFRKWLLQDDPPPLDKVTNGSAMRVSSTGWLYDTIERTRQVARNTAEVSHNSPEGIRGAESVASAIFLARNAATKDDIKIFVEREFGYDLSRKLDDIRPTYRPVFNCDNSVPEAIISFLESTDFIDALRNAVSLGGDSDTLAAIAGSIAEAFYGFPDELVAECNMRLPDDMRDVLRRFNYAMNFGLEKKQNC